MNIYKRKDGRFEGRIPLGYDDKGKIKYKFLYAKSLAEIKEKMLYAYADAGSPERVACDKTFKNLCEEWLASAKLRVKHSSYCCYEKLIGKHIIPYISYKINVYIRGMRHNRKYLGRDLLSQNLQIRVITQQFGYIIRFATAYIFKTDG